mmetsp:Transcript_34949/g.76410  ORF Transcript_34949/g.76410 Transcript_34949/m.76410 type:complete len:220 (-) Transcript_34949:155-814(-)
MRHYKSTCGKWPRTQHLNTARPSTSSWLPRSPSLCLRWCWRRAWTGCLCVPAVRWCRWDPAQGERRRTSQCPVSTCRLQCSIRRLRRPAKGRRGWWWWTRGTSTRAASGASRCRVCAPSRRPSAASPRCPSGSTRTRGSSRGSRSLCTVPEGCGASAPPPTSDPRGRDLRTWRSSRAASIGTWRRSPTEASSEGRTLCSTSAPPWALAPPQMTPPWGPA